MRRLTTSVPPALVLALLSLMAWRAFAVAPRQPLPADPRLPNVQALIDRGAAGPVRLSVRDGATCFIPPDGNWRSRATRLFPGAALVHDERGEAADWYLVSVKGGAAAIFAVEDATLGWTPPADRSQASSYAFCPIAVGISRGPGGAIVAPLAASERSCERDLRLIVATLEDALAGKAIGSFLYLQAFFSTNLPLSCSYAAFEAIVSASPAFRGIDTAAGLPVARFGPDGVDAGVAYDQKTGLVVHAWLGFGK